MNTESNAEPGTSLGCFLVFLMFLYGLAQIAAGWIGIEHQWGSGWATVAVVAAAVFRFSLPLTVGAFLCAMNVWGWHWFGALFFALPGLAFMALMIPGALAKMIGQQNRG